VASSVRALGGCQHLNSIPGVLAVLALTHLVRLTAWLLAGSPGSAEWKYSKSHLVGSGDLVCGSPGSWVHLVDLEVPLTVCSLEHGDFGAQVADQTDPPTPYALRCVGTLSSKTRRHLTTYGQYWVDLDFQPSPLLPVLALCSEMRGHF